MTLEQCWHRVPGGTAVAAIETARALARRGDVELIGVAARHKGPAPSPWRPPVKVDQLSLPRLALYESWHRLRRPAVQRATGEVDAIHATTLAVPPASAPLVVTVHDLAWRDHPGHFTRRGISFFERGLALARRDASLVLCPSNETRRDCETAGFEPDRLRLVPNGVTVDEANPEEVAAARKRYGLDRPYVLWTGTVEPRKNLGNLLAAFRHVDAGFDLVLVGPRGWNEDLESHTAGVRDRVKVLGFISQNDLAPLYAGAEVYCYPSLKEGFGLPVLEAMAQGTPVVTSAGTATEEVAGDAGVLVDPNDPLSIANGIGRIIDDARVRDELSSAGRRRAAEFTWARTAELTIAAYEEVS